MFSTVSTVRMGTPTFLRHAWPMTLGLLVCASVSVGHVLSSPASTTIQWLGAACLAVTLLGAVALMRRAHATERDSALAQQRWQMLTEGHMDAALVLKPRQDIMGRAMGYEIAEANAAAHALYVAPSGALLGHMLFDVLPCAWPETFQTRLDQCWHTGMRQEDEHSLPTPDAPRGLRWLHHQMIRLPDGVVVLTRDITDVRHSMQALQEQETFYRTLVNSLPMAAYARSTREHNRGQYVVWNEVAARIMNLPTEQVLGKQPHEVLPLDIARRAEQQDHSVMSGGASQVYEDLVFHTQDGDRIVNLIKTPVHGMDGALDHILSIAIDVTEQRQAADQLRLASRVIDETGEAIVITDAMDRVVRVNPAFLSMSGLAMSDVMGQFAELLGMPPLRESHLQGINHALLKGQRWVGESQQVRQDGRTLDVWLSVSTLRQDAMGITQHIRVFSDISVLKAQQRELAEQARNDMLTGLPNRRAFGERLRQAMARARRTPQTLAVLFIDLDGFKAVNDRWGHAGGDVLLQEVAARLLQCVRNTDCVCRLAGDEFTVILEGAGHPQELLRIGERIIQRVSEPLALGNGALQGMAQVTPSIGAAIYQRHDTEQSLCERADAAMYQAKRQGKARLILSDTRTESDNASCQKLAVN